MPPFDICISRLLSLLPIDCLYSLEAVRSESLNKCKILKYILWPLLLHLFFASKCGIYVHIIYVMYLAGITFIFDPSTAGNVVCSWGRGEDGQLGHGDTDDRFLPTKLSALDGQDIVSITCGADHTMAHSESGREVYSWGWSVLHLSYFSVFCHN